MADAILDFEFNCHFKGYSGKKRPWGMLYQCYSLLQYDRYTLPHAIAKHASNTV